MSTTINVTVGGNALLDQSRQQMQANRFGKLERDQDGQAQSAAQRVQDAKKKADDLTGRVLQQRRADQEPAANRYGGYDFGFITYQRAPSVLYSMDGQSSVSMGYESFPEFFTKPVTIPGELQILDYFQEGSIAAYRDVDQIDSLQVALPAGGQSAVFIDATQRFKSFTTDALVGNFNGGPGEYEYVFNYFDQTQSHYQIDCYFVATSSVKQIALPSQLESVLRSYVMTGLSLDFTITTDAFGNQTKRYKITRDPTVSPRGLFERYGIISAAGEMQVFSPAIYSFLANAQRCNADNQTDSYANTSYAYFTEVAGTTLYAKSHVYAALSYLRNLRSAYQWTAALPADLGDFPLDPFLPPEYTQLDSRFRRVGIKKPVPQRPAVDASYPDILYWDGGNAGYCHQQLLSLGFTSEDLTP